jgi:dihydrofolate reductase
MGRLIYSTIQSLDGYIYDADGRFDWAEPDVELHQFVNDDLRSVGTHLYGRRMYETMAAWETMHTLPGQSPVTLDFARIWQAADKVVYSATLDEVSSARTRIERTFDPPAVGALVKAAERDVMIGGAVLAGSVIRAGLVDEFHLSVVPVLVGGGQRSLPDDVRVPLELMAERRFGNGVVHLRYNAC